MRIQQLLLTAFGPFTDQRLSFEKTGLHVVYGPNEAGKTSALRAIQAALFGIPVRTNDNFLHANNKLRVGAILQQEDGSELHFLRRKGNKNTLLNPELDVETAYPDSVLNSFLTGVDAESFAQIHGIDHQRLRQGGEQLQQLQGLVGESLFAAGMGGVSLAKVLSSLATEADDLFSSKRTCRIRAAKSKHAEALKARQAAEVPSSKWQKLQDELAEVQREREAILQRYTAAQRERNRLLRIQSALQPLAKRARLIAELTELGDVPILPDEYSSAQRSHIHGRIVELTEQEKQLAHKLDGPDGLRNQLQQLDLPQELLARREPIHQLRQQMGAYLKARQDLDGPLRLEQQTIASQIRTLLEDLGDDSPGDAHILATAKRWLIGSAQRRSIQALAQEEKTVRTSPHAAQQKLDDLQNHLQHQQAALDSVGEVPDTLRLAELIEQAQLSGDLDNVIDELSSTCDDTQQQIDARFASLGLWNGALADVTKLALPLHETIERFQKQFDQQASRSEQLQLALADCQQEISEVTATIDALQQAGRVPSEDDLDAARNIRNQTWAAIRQAWPNGQLDLDSLTEAIANYSGAQGYSLQSAEEASEFFEDTVADADDLADRLRREADRVAQVGERLARVKQLQEKQTLLQQEQERSTTRHSELQQQWLEVWQPLGITAPLPPLEMLRWMDRVFKLQELLAEQDLLQKRLATKQKQQEQLKNQIRSEMETIQPQKMSPEDSLRQWLVTANSMLRTATDSQQQKAAIVREIQRLQRESSAVQQQRAAAEHDFRQWHAQWQTAMEAIGCAENATAVQATERLHQLDELASLVKEWRSLDERAARIRQDAAAFEKRVTEIATAMEADTTDETADVRLAKIDKQLSDAIEAEQHHAHLNARRKEVQQEHQRVADELQRLTAEMKAYCELAGVDSPESLPEVEATSDQVTQRRLQLREVEQHLKELCEQAGGLISLESLSAEASAYTLEELNLAVEESEQVFSQMAQERETVAARLNELQTALQQIDQRAQAVEADEASLSLLADMHQAARQYMLLRCAAVLLQHQIERHRAKHQNPILKAASVFFRQLTCAEFDGLSVIYDDADRALIVGVRANSDVPVQVEQMSGGTRDQLFLALRLAYLESRMDQHPPMPLIVDDILIEFDNDRSAAALQLLAEFSSQTQVIFFTHHHHLIDVATRAGVQPFQLTYLEPPGAQRRHSRPV